MTRPPSIYTRIDTRVPYPTLFRSGIARPLPAGFGLESGDEVVDLHEARDLAALEHDWLLSASASLARGELQQLALDFADGRGWILARGQRWQIGRAPV